MGRPVRTRDRMPRSFPRRIRPTAISTLDPPAISSIRQEYRIAIGPPPALCGRPNLALDGFDAATQPKLLDRASELQIESVNTSLIDGHEGSANPDIMHGVTRAYRNTTLPPAHAIEFRQPLKQRYFS